MLAIQNEHFLPHTAESGFERLLKLDSHTKGALQVAGHDAGHPAGVAEGEGQGLPAMVAAALSGYHTTKTLHRKQNHTTNTHTHTSPQTRTNKHTHTPRTTQKPKHGNIQNITT